MRSPAHALIPVVSTSTTRKGTSRNGVPASSVSLPTPDSPLIIPPSPCACFALRPSLFALRPSPFAPVSPHHGSARTTGHVMHRGPPPPRTSSAPSNVMTARSSSAIRSCPVRNASESTRGHPEDDQVADRRRREEQLRHEVDRRRARPLAEADGDGVLAQRVHVAALEGVVDAPVRGA